MTICVSHEHAVVHAQHSVVDLVAVQILQHQTQLAQDEDQQHGARDQDASEFSVAMMTTYKQGGTIAAVENEVIFQQAS